MLASMAEEHELGEAPLPGLPGLEPAEDGARVRRAGRGRAAPERPHHLGHRARLRERLARAGPEALADYELLELLLFLAIPRRDVKGLAKTLLATFGDLGGVLAAPRERLVEVPGVSDGVVHALRVVDALAQRMARRRVLGRQVISSWDQLLEYCRTAMGSREREQFRVLYLDRRNALIADELLAEGTVDHVAVYPREVVRRALALHASALILVHNHPSGDPTPSEADITMTWRIRDAAEALGIVLHDHLIIGRGRELSFREEGHL